VHVTQPNRYIRPPVRIGTPEKFQPHKYNCNSNHTQRPYEIIMYASIKEYSKNEKVRGRLAKLCRLPCTACWRCGAAAALGRRCLRCTAQNWHLKYTLHDTITDVEEKSGWLGKEKLMFAVVIYIIRRVVIMFWFIDAKMYNRIFQITVIPYIWYTYVYANEGPW